MVLEASDFDKPGTYESARLRFFYDENPDRIWEAPITATINSCEQLNAKFSS